MKRLIGLIVISLFIWSVPVYAQFPRFGGRQAMQMFAPFGSGFNPESIVEVTGKIKRLTNVKGRMIPTVAAIIEDSVGDEFEVRLGPMMFIRNMKSFSFKKGLEIDVVGSQIGKQDKREVIIATTITVDGEETVLRDQMGIPVWAPISRKGGGGGGGMMGMMGMMGGGGTENKDKTPAKSMRPSMKTIPGASGQQIQVFGDGDEAEEAEDLQGGKIPGGYK